MFQYWVRRFSGETNEPSQFKNEAQQTTYIGCFKSIPSKMEFKTSARDCISGYPETSNATLLPHQIDVIGWMRQQEYNSPTVGGGAYLRRVSGGIIGDTGLGKIQSVATFVAASAPARTLVACSKSTQYLWYHELARHGLITYQLHPNHVRRVVVFECGQVGLSLNKPLSAIKSNSVCVVAHGDVQPFHCNARHKETDLRVEAEPTPDLIPFNSIVWDRVIASFTNDIDCNISSEFGVVPNAAMIHYLRMSRLRTTKTAGRWALIGTPSNSYPLDMHAMFRWIGIHPVVSLETCIAQKLFRRTVDNLHPALKSAFHPSDVPTITTTTVVYQSDEEASIYKRMAKFMREKLAATVVANVSPAESFELSTLVRYLVAYPTLFASAVSAKYPKTPFVLPTIAGPISKHEMIMDYISQSDEPESFAMLVYCKEETELLSSVVEAMGFTVTYIGLGSSLNQINNAIRDTLRGMANGELHALFANPFACSEGVDLRHFDTIIIPSPDLNSAMEDGIIAYCCSPLCKVIRFVHEAVVAELSTFATKSVTRVPTESERLIASLPNAAELATTKACLPNRAGVPATQFATRIPIVTTVATATATPVAVAPVSMPKTPAAELERRAKMAAAAMNRLRTPVAASC